MSTGRIEAFSDAVLAIVMTVMVLELSPPDGTDLASLWASTGTGLLTYLVSFVYIGIYWNNHHHLFQVAEHVDGATLWANLHLLFWISLMPFTTAWMDRTGFAQVPVLVCSVCLLASSLAYLLLQRTLVRHQPTDSPLRRALHRDGVEGRLDLKGRLSLAAHVLAVACAALAGVIPRPVAIPAALGALVLAALLWLVPDRRLETAHATAD